MIHRKRLVLFVGIFALLALTCSLPQGGDIQATAQSLLQTGTAIFSTAQVEATELYATLVVAAEATLSAQLTQAATQMTPAVPTAPPTQASGSISGSIPYAYPPVSSVTIFAREMASGKVYSTVTADGQTAYTIAGLPSGTYVVVGWFYPQGASGAYTSSGVVTAQTSAEQAACGQLLVQVHLAAGQSFSGADIGCWGSDFFYLVTPSP